MVIIIYGAQVGEDLETYNAKNVVWVVWKGYSAICPNLRHKSMLAIALFVTLQHTELRTYSILWIFKAFLTWYVHKTVDWGWLGE